MTKRYDTETKPALRAVERACFGPDAPLPLADIKSACDAAVAAGATPNEIAEAVGGREAWNAFVRGLKGAGLV